MLIIIFLISISLLLKLLKETLKSMLRARQYAQEQYEEDMDHVSNFPHLCTVEKAVKRYNENIKDAGFYVNMKGYLVGLFARKPILTVVLLIAFLLAVASVLLEAAIVLILN